MAERFDVVMPTLNSVSRVGEDIFRKVLQRICTEIPLNRLLLIDDGSRDGTLDVANDFNAIIINGAGSLGKAREIGIHEVETEWFYFIDDDNLIPRNFHKMMWQHIDEKTGMIFPNAVIPYDNYLVRYEAIARRIRQTLKFKEVVETRGYTGATLVRTKAVKGIRIPKIARQEDKFIKSYCEMRGWKTKFLSDIIVLHFHKDLPSYETQYREGYGLAKVRALSKTRVLISWLLTYPKTLLTLPYVRKIAMLSEIPRMYYTKYKGYLNALSVKTTTED